MKYTSFKYKNISEENEKAFSAIGKRSMFSIPSHNGKPLIYFCGNSLGLQPKMAVDKVNEEMSKWASLGVDAHFEQPNPWVSYHRTLTSSLARMVGAHHQEIVAMNSLSINIHLLLVSFYRPTPQRYKILIERPQFPSDRFAIESQLRWHNIDPDGAIIELVPDSDSYTITTSCILEAIETHRDQLALVFLGGVNYYTGQVFDLHKITQKAHEAGALAGYDLAHMIGNIPMQLHDWQVDFATWCSYKYLNGGPGGVSGIYIHENHFRQSGLQRLEGWWGNDETSRFKMQSEFVPGHGAEAWQLSNAPILAMASLRAALDIFDMVGITTLRKMSIAMTSMLYKGLTDLIQDHPQSEIRIITPTMEADRGCQLSLLVKREGKNLYNYLRENGIVLDWREPDVMRMAPVPLYNTFDEIAFLLELLSSYLKLAAG